MKLKYLKASKCVPFGITKKKNGIFLVVDVVAILTDNKNPSDYLKKTPKRDEQLVA